MNRRGFLQGLFGGVTAAGVIVAAKPSEIEAFTAPLVKDAPIFVDVPRAQPVGAGEHLYNARGELVAVVMEISLSREAIDVTLASDLNRVYIPGRLMQYEIRAEGVGRVEMDVNRPYSSTLRGVSR